MASAEADGGPLELSLLQQLSACGAQAHTLSEAASHCAASLRRSPADLPFAAIYLLDPGSALALQAMATSPGVGTALPTSVPLVAGDPWQFKTALERAVPIVIRIPPGTGSGSGPIAASRESAAVVALVEPHGSERLGVLVAGLNPRRAFAHDYRAWIQLVGVMVAGVLSRARARESARSQDAALEESERRFVWFMNHLPGLAWIKDAEGRYLFVNAAAARAFGRYRADILNRSDDEIFPPDTAAEFKRNDMRALAGGGAVETVETLEHEDGVHHSLVSKFPIPAPHGATLIGGIAIDVTELKRSEHSLLEADRHKDEFLAILAHELRNPLAPMRNALETMRLAGPADAQALGQARGILQRQLQQMVRLIDDLLDIGRISRGTLELRKQPLTLAEVLESALETMRPMLDASGRRLVVECPAAKEHLDGDLTRLAQVFANLLHNAVKYTEAGGHIRLHARRDAASLVVSVADDGVGIPAEALPRIFDMFTQVDRAGTSRGGLGVGLNIVRTIVAMHGGSVEARSAGRGRGAEFVVRLPAQGARDVAASRDKPAAPPPSPPRPRRILVVDDNRDAAASLALMLEMKGNEVRTVGDGREAFGVAEQFRPDVILLDIGLPGLDGHGVCRRIREQPWGHDLPIVALTGWSQEEDRRRSRESGFTDHLVKPAEPAHLDRLLAALPPPPPLG